MRVWHRRCCRHRLYFVCLRVTIVVASSEPLTGTHAMPKTTSNRNHAEGRSLTLNVHRGFAVPPAESGHPSPLSRRSVTVPSVCGLPVTTARNTPEEQNSPSNFGRQHASSASSCVMSHDLSKVPSTLRSSVNTTLDLPPRKPDCGVVAECRPNQMHTDATELSSPDRRAASEAMSTSALQRDLSRAGIARTVWKRTNWCFLHYGVSCRPPPCMQI